MNDSAHQLNDMRPNYISFMGMHIHIGQRIPGLRGINFYFK